MGKGAGSGRDQTRQCSAEAQTGSIVEAQGGYKWLRAYGSMRGEAWASLHM